MFSGGRSRFDRSCGNELIGSDQIARVVKEETWDWRSFRGLQDVKVSPFIKWAGGKGQLLEYMKFPARFGTYHEPFLGGGATFFGLQPPSAFLSDVNEELTNAYRVVKENVEDLITSLKQLAADYSEEEFYNIRAQDPSWLESVDRAARFIFLNKTCYNGLYRVNRKGKFNVPFGRYKAPRICDPDSLRSASEVLQHAIVKARDFRDALKLVEPGDFVYLDPPYVPVSKTSNFTEYTSKSFTWFDHEALAEEAVRLRDEVRCFVLVSNSYQAKVKSLYERLGFRIQHVAAQRVIGSSKASRGRINELLIRNY